MTADRRWAFDTETLTEGETLVSKHVLIISRHHPGLFRYVSQRFAGEESVEVILDRRRGQRRGRVGSVEIERRASDRRSRPHVDEALRIDSMQFVTIPDIVSDRSHPVY